MKFSSFPAKKPAILLSAFFLFVFLIFFVTSCQRDVQHLPDKKFDAANMPEGLAKLIKDQGYSFSVELNKHVPGILLDKNGNVIETRRPGSARLLSTPDEICEDPASAEVDPTLLYVENTVSDCVNQTHTITVHWQIKSSFDLALANPSPPNQASRGRLRIKNGTTTTFSDLNINLTAGNLVYVGVDPIDPTLKIYNVTYVKTGIAHTYLALGNFTSLEVSLAVYSDCDDPYDPYLITTPYTVAFSPQVGLNVCERNDLVYINPNTPSSPPPFTDYCASIAGSWAIGSPGACQNYDANLGSQVQVKRTGDPDGNYTNLQVKAAGDPSWRTNGYVFSWEVLWMRELQAYVPNAPGSFPASYTFRWRNFEGVYSPFSISCSTPYWYTPLTLSIYNF